MNNLGVVELCISIHSFANIELHSQGWYAVRIRVLPDPRIKSVSLVSVVDSELGDKPPRNQVWTLDEWGSWFRSRIFRVRYCYEEDIGGLSCIIELELLFQDSDMNNPNAVPSTFHLKSVAKDHICVGQAALGVQEYYGCTFDSDHFGLLNVGIFSLLMGFNTQEALDSAAKGNGALRAKSSWVSYVSPGSPRRRDNLRASLDQQSDQRLMPAMVHAVPGTPAGTGGQDVAGQKSMMAAVAAAVAGSPKAASTAATLLATAEQLQSISRLYSLLVEPLKESHTALWRFLKGLPPACYAPQTFDILRTLLAGKSGHDANKGALNGGLTASLGRPLENSAGVLSEEARITAEVNNWPDVPDSTGFLLRLPTGSTLGAALQHLDAAMQRVRQALLGDWRVLLWLVRISLRELLRYMKCVWELEQPSLVRPWLVAGSAMHEHELVASMLDMLRQGIRLGKGIEVPRVHQTSFWGRMGEHPILLVDDSLAQSCPPCEAAKLYSTCDVKDEAHVVIFVHGFQGTRTDLCLIKAHLMLLFPYLDCFCSKANEDKTQDSLQEMGKRLAEEILEFVMPLEQSSRKRVTRISFVGHSIGNLILRSALSLSLMQPYLQRLYLYISISGPHLGTMYSNNSMLETGISVLKNISKGRCLHQLSLSDAHSVRDCYLYKLATQHGMPPFKHIILVSSQQDRYVPFHSSRISMCKAVNLSDRKGAAYKEMTDRLLQDVGTYGKTQLFRVDVDFDLKSKSFSFSKLVGSAVGRLAHIELIESGVYAWLLAWGVLHKYSLLPPAEHAWL